MLTLTIRRSPFQGKEIVLIKRRNDINIVSKEKNPKVNVYLNSFRPGVNFVRDACIFSLVLV